MKHINKEKKSNKPTAEQRSARKRLTTRIITGVSVSLVLIYIVFVFVTTNFMGDDSIVTQIVYKSSTSDIVRSTGFVIRNETCIKNDQNGVLVYNVDDGDKIKAGGVIAVAYNSESDATNYQKISELEKNITELQTLNKTANSANIGIDSIKKQIDQNLTTFIGNINSRNFDMADDSESNLMSSIFRMQIITGDIQNLNQSIENLEQEKAKLEENIPQSIGSVTSDYSGYFVSDVDGYEDSFSVDDLSQISYEKLEKVQQKKVNSSEYVGKVVQGVNWYIACPVSVDEATSITHNNSYISVKLPFVISGSIPASVVSVNKYKDSDKAVVILSCNSMNDSLAKIRKETVDIQLNSYEGLKINKLALHDDEVTKTTTDENGSITTEKKRVQGVFVKFGSELIFKQVSILYSADDYVICDENPEDGILFNGTTVSVYDEVVIEGKDLYDGKLIK